jgi:hypothetical protein
MSLTNNISGQQLMTHSVILRGPLRRPPQDDGKGRELLQLANLNQTKGACIMWEKIKTWFKHSVTILWARIVAAAGLLLAAGQSVLQDPNVNAAIQNALQPKYIPYYVIVIGLVTEIARRRTANKV